MARPDLCADVGVTEVRDACLTPLLHIATGHQTGVAGIASPARLGIPASLLGEAPLPLGQRRNACRIYPLHPSHPANLPAWQAMSRPNTN